MSTIDKIKVGDTTYDISNIKVAEIKGVYDSEQDIFIFNNDDLKIDYRKNIRIDVWKTGVQYQVCSYTIAKTVDGFMVIDNEDGAEVGYGDIFFGLLLNIYRQQYNDFYGEFLISFDINNLFEVSSSDELIMKVSYIEANELTVPFIFEM